MPVEGREKGLRTKTTVRYGSAQTPTYAGINRQKKANALSDIQGPDAINLRIVGGRPVSRGGQEKLNASTIEPIHGFVDTTTEGAREDDLDTPYNVGTPYAAMYIIGNDAIGVAGSFIHVDRETDVVVTTGIHDGGRPDAVPIDFDGSDYGTISYNETDTEVVEVPSLDSLFVLPRAGTIANCWSILALGSELLAAWQDSGTAMKVSMWDGSLHADLSIAYFDGYLFLVKFAGTAFLCLTPTASAVNLLYRRNGAASWSSIAYPGATAFRAHSAKAYKGRLYIVGLDDGDLVVYSTDGVTLTRDHVVTLPTSGSYIISQLALSNGHLLYWYHDGEGGADFSLIGRYDGTSWLDQEKVLTNDIPAATYTRGYGFIANDDGANVVYGDDSGHIHIWESPGKDIFGTWTEVLDYDAGIYGAGSLTPPVRVGTVSA